MVILGDILASLIIYHQPIYSWSVIPAAVLGTSIYAVAAYILKHKIKIDRTLTQLSDVLRYLAVTLTAAIFATVAGVTCTAADGSIKWNQFWDSAIGWYIGDAVGLLSVAPFLLIYVFPGSEEICSNDRVRATSRRPSLTRLCASTSPPFWKQPGKWYPFFFLWIIFGPLAPKEYFYLAFVPIIWMAMRHGIERVVIGLLILNFGIVVALRFFPAPPQILTKSDS